MRSYVDKDNEDIPAIEWRVWNKFYYNGGYRVLTEYGNAARAKCCGCGCIHCPYSPSMRGSTSIREDLKGKFGYRLGPID